MSEKEKKIIEEALERFKQSKESTQEFRREFESDLKFVADDQWDSLARQQRTSSSRPCFTIDRINPALRQIVNEERQNRPSIRVDPTSDGATEEVATVIADMIRHIEQDSNAESAYDTAGWYAAAGGIGYLRVRSEYESPTSFNQILKIETVADPMTVFLDYDSVTQDGKDAHWGFIVTNISKDEFRVKYPDSKMLKKLDQINGDWGLYEANDPEWVDEDDIRVAEYFYKDYTPKTLYQVLDKVSGEVIETFERPPEEVVLAGFAEILNSRPTHECVVRWCIMTSEEILHQSTFPGPYIPIVPVYGEDYWVNGKRYTCGAVRRAKEAQKLLNFTTSLQAEIIDLNAKSPWIGAAGQFDTFEDNWRDANRKNFGYLEYNAIDINGTPIAAPTRNAIEAPISSVQQTKMQAVEDIKAIFGIYDASLGAAGNETSGVAILARKAQSGVSNYHYYDNLVRSVKQIGRILVDAIPIIYDTPRMVRIIKPNGEHKMAAINMVAENGKMMDLSIGRYDVVVATGPAYATRRQEMVEGGLSLLQAYPNAAPLIADVIADQMDFEGAKIMAKRLRAAVPPEILEATNDTEGMDNEAKVQALTGQVKQMKQALEALNAHSAQVEQELKLEKEEKILLKMKQDVELKKAEMDQLVKLKGFEIDEQKTELEFLVKEQELMIQKRQMALEEAKLQLMGVQAMVETEDKIFDRSIEHVNRVATAKPGEGETGLGDIQFDAPDIAQASDRKSSPTGLTGQM